MFDPYIIFPPIHCVGNKTLKTPYKVDVNDSPDQRAWRLGLYYDKLVYLISDSYRREFECMSIPEQ